MANNRESLEQAVERIAYETRVEINKIGSKPFMEVCEAALRQMAAWAYRDAAEFADSAHYANYLENKAREVERG